MGSVVCLRVCVWITYSGELGPPGPTSTFSGTRPPRSRPVPDGRALDVLRPPGKSSPGVPCQCVGRPFSASSTPEGPREVPDGGAGGGDRSQWGGGLEGGWEGSEDGVRPTWAGASRTRGRHGTTRYGARPGPLHKRPICRRGAPGPASRGSGGTEVVVGKRRLWRRVRCHSLGVRFLSRTGRISFDWNRDGMGRGETRPYVATAGPRPRVLVARGPGTRRHRPSLAVLTHRPLSTLIAPW